MASKDTAMTIDDGGEGVNTGNSKLQKVSFEVCRIRFDVDPAYRLDHLVGNGAYGTICKATVLATGDAVAVKKIGNVFNNLLDAKRTLREIKLLNFLKHDNIVQIMDIMTMDKETYEDMYIVMELMETDLRKVIKSDQLLSDDHVQYFLYQILRGLKYIHSAGILHRDLKPANILLDTHCNLKLCDFGLSRIDDMHHDDDMNGGADYTEYVVTRWYRAPEVIFERGAYSKAVDMWSVGCIFAEMLARKPLFPGKDHVDQLSLIYSILGTPSQAEIEAISNTMAREHMQKIPYKKKIPFSHILPYAPPLALDLLDRMLATNPSQRITAVEALEHPYLAALHNEFDEPSAPEEMSFAYEERDLDVNDLRELMHNEHLLYHPELGEYRPC